MARLVLGLSLAGCGSAPADLIGYPVNTPEFYSENKVFFVERLAAPDQHSQQLVELEHLFEVTTDGDRNGDVIQHNDPLSVVLQGVRLPEASTSATRDIAVVLDIHTSLDRGTTQLLAFYQRDVPAGQMLNFNNLLVYADPQWDEANPPYFRIRVLDVKAERNRRTAALMSKVSNLSAQIGGMVPHPAIPIVTSAIDAASLVMSNQENVVILDYQIQFYSERQVGAAGGATIGRLLAGQWLVLGRERNRGSDFWATDLFLDRKTDRIMTRRATSGAATGSGAGGSATSAGVATANVPVPYVSVTLIKADAEVPKLVLDRSQALLSLLSTPAGKSDIDAVSQAADSLMSSVEAFAVERRLRKYRSKADLAAIIRRLSDDSDARKDPDSGKKALNTHERRRLIYVLNRVTEPAVRFDHADDWVNWWETGGGDQGSFVDSDVAPLGIEWRVAASDKSGG